MSKKIQAPRGMNDVLPEQSPDWQTIESLLRTLNQSYGYEEIRFPIVEKTNLFKRSIGEITDIVEKEMYTFEDRNGDSLTLRPEGTAPCVRAGIENGLFYNQQQRLWYMGPMFRHERPQRGRYRQFYQCGVEAYGFEGPDIDVELLALSLRYWRALGLENDMRLELNSLGTSACRLRYRDALVTYFNKYKESLDDDSLRRLATNPLRILDSKNPELENILANAPMIGDYLSSEAKTHFAMVCHCLDELQIVYTINPRIVRGLDYYCHTVFEWVTDLLGAQGTVCAGGRYNHLVEQLGGHPTPATGFALGIERLIELYRHANAPTSRKIDIYFVYTIEDGYDHAMKITESLRDTFPTLRLILNCGGGSMKTQFKKADRSQAKLAFVLGADELAEKTISIKHLRQEKAQERISLSDLSSFIQNYLLEQEAL